MISRENILEIIYNALDEVNEQLPKSKHIAKLPESPIYGKDGNLDSLGLVNMIVSVESGLEDIDLNLVLADEKAMSQANSPFKNVSTLADYILKLAEQENA